MTMTRFLSFAFRVSMVLLFCALCTVHCPLLFGQGTAGPVVGGTGYSNLEGSFGVPSVSWAATGLTLTYTAGAVYQKGNANSITAGSVTLTTNETSCSQAGVLAGSCNLVYWPGSGSSLAATTSYPMAAANGNEILYFCTTTSGGNIGGCAIATQDVLGAVPATYTDGLLMVPVSNCAFTPTTTAFASSGITRIAANEIAWSGTTNTTAGTIAMTCDLGLEGRTTSGLGFIVKDVAVQYGVQTTALSSIATPTLKINTYPAYGGSAANTLTAVGGTITSTPSTLQVATTTAGNFYNADFALGTPFTLTDQTKVSFDMVFTTAGSTATTLQVSGLLVHGSWVQ
jgi:hypothetical protein